MSFVGKLSFYVQQHIQCEEKKGNYYSNLNKLIENDNFEYCCPHCRLKKNDNKLSNSMLRKKRTKNQNHNCKLFHHI